MRGTTEGQPVLEPTHDAASNQQVRHGFGEGFVVAEASVGGPRAAEEALGSIVSPLVLIGGSLVPLPRAVPQAPAPERP